MDDNKLVKWLGSYFDSKMPSLNNPKTAPLSISQCGIFSGNLDRALNIFLGIFWYSIGKFLGIFWCSIGTNICTTIFWLDLFLLASKKWKLWEVVCRNVKGFYTCQPVQKITEKRKWESEKQDIRKAQCKWVLFFVFYLSVAFSLTLL